jgi:hypothetical protein
VKTTLDILSDLSKHTYNQITFYRFNKGILQVSDKYRKGRLTALNYVAKLTLYYMNIEKSLPRQLQEQINKQMEQNSCLNSGEYKDGMYDALNEILDEYHKNITPNQGTKGTK